MAQWIHYIELFPEEKQPVIQNFKNLMEVQFGINQLEAFRSSFDSITFNEIPSSSHADDFFISLSSWLAFQASGIEDWGAYSSNFDTKDLPYITTVVDLYQGIPVAEFAALDINERANTIRTAEGFIEAYKTTLAEYLSELPLPLVITSHPTSKQVDWNTNYTLSVGATSGSTIEYQWRKNGTPINGATDSTYELLNVRTSVSGQYDCILTDTFDQIISYKSTIEVTSFESQIGIVYGKVERNNETPVSGIVVKVIDKKPGSIKVVGFTVTNNEGEYYLEYLNSALLDQETFLANLVVQLIEQGESEPSESSALIEGASLSEEVNFSTDVFGETETEFSRLDTHLNNQLDPGVVITELDREEIQLLINKAFSEEMIVDYINAEKLNSLITTVSKEQFYGMLRVGLPSTAEELVTMSDQNIISALTNASEHNIINTIDAASMQNIADEINGEAPSIILQSESNPFKTVFEKVNLSAAKQTSLIQNYLNDPKGENDLLNSSSLTTEEVASIQRVITLSELDSTNHSIVDVLDDKVGISGEPTQLTDLVTLSNEGWEALIDNDQEDLLSIPPRFVGSNEEQKTAYAQELKDAVELQEPTKVLAYQMNADTEFQSETFDQFFGDNPNFELGNEQIAVYLENNPLDEANYSDINEAQKELEAAQRLFHLSPKTERFNTIKPLLDNDLTSASQIAIMGEANFVSAYGNSIGIKKAKTVFANAAHVHGRVTHALVTHTNTLSPTVLTSGETGTTGSIPGIPDLETIFGSLDYCKCTHCRSVYSPAAYLVDLLNFIDSENGSNNDLKAELLNRRGEISKLFLHCDNTNTPLPYIDIVNEILENHILVNHLNLDGSGNPTNTPFLYQTETDAETLEATPQNTIENVYSDTLSTAIHPIELPFSLWFEQAKAYLKQSDVDLGEFIAAAPINELSSTRKELVSAAASLGIPVEQLDIITGTIAHSAIALYNVSGLGNLVNPVSTFIEKAGVSYEELVELMDSKFINPLKKQIYFPTDGSCNLEAMSIGDPENYSNPNPVSGFNEGELQRFNRFVRLMRLTGFTAKELDLIINSLTPSIINDTTIINLYHAASLKEKYKVSIEEMITWWSDFDVATYIDEALFDKLFQDTSVNSETNLIPRLVEMESFTGKSFLDTDIKPLALGALNISAYDLDVILSQNQMSSDANVENFSSIFRIVSFTKAIGLSVEEYFTQKALVEEAGIKESTNTSPLATISFIEAIDLVDSTPFSEAEIEYLKSGDNTISLALNEDPIVEFIEEIRNDYQNLTIEFSEVSNDPNADMISLATEFGLDAQTITEVARGGETIASSSLETEGIITATEVSAIQTRIDDVINSTTLTDSEKTEQGQRIVLDYLLRFKHLNTDFKAAVIEKLGFFHDLSASLAELIYTQNGSPLINSILDLNYLGSSSEIEINTNPGLVNDLNLGHKMATIAKTLNTSTKELDYLLNDLPSTYLNLSSLPVENQDTISFDTIRPLLSFRNLDNTFFNRELTLIDFLDQQTNANRSSLLAEATGWRENDIDVLIGSEGFNFEATPEVYSELNWIDKLSALIPLMGKAKLDANALINLQLHQPNKDTAFALRNFLSSGLDRQQWIKVASSIHDKIREQKRDAMVAFLIAQETNFTNTRDVYDHFLIDTQMSACQLTSRIKQAVSAIQLFVQRIGLGFEGDLMLTEDKMQEWNWRKNYRVWEANRKVFLYPENYTLPEVRSNTSPLYDSFEETLTQGEIDDRAAEMAFQKYLEGFKEIANLEVVQMTQDDEKNELHVIAKTQSEPARYFHRSLKNRTVWSAWELIPVEMNGGLLPVVHKGELIVCWLDKRDKREVPNDVKFDPDTDSQGYIKGSTVKEPTKKTEIRLAWASKTSEGWGAKSTSNEYKVFAEDEVEFLNMIPMKNDVGELYINLIEYTGSLAWNRWGYKYYLGRFVEIEENDLTQNYETADQYFMGYTVTNTATQVHQIDPVYTWSEYYNDPNRPPGGNSFPKWRNYDLNLRRNLNYGRLNSIFGSATENSGVVGKADKYFAFKNQQLEIPSLDKFNYPSLVSVGLRLQPDNVTTIKTLLSFNRKLLTQTNGKKFTLIGSIDHFFPFLSNNSVLYNMENTTPFLLKEGNKTYLVYPEFFDSFGSLNVTDYNILALPVDSLSSIFQNIYS